MERLVKVKECTIGLGQPLTIIAGPCVVENEKMILYTAENMAKMVEDLPIQFIFKSSYKKANRTSLENFSGVGFEKALDILQKVTREFSLPLLTDVHTELEVPLVAEIADILQIPAFLCRQTDLLLAAGATQKVVNIKKGPFLAPDAMAKAAEKVKSCGNSKILLTERGTTFGYHNLVVDMRNLIIMAKQGYPVVYDATHSVQLPGDRGNQSGGQPEYILPLAKAAIATGTVSAIFMEVHPNPKQALSDAATQLSLQKFPVIIDELLNIYDFIN
jgi:2-dehydro-3-deoxyphosphooctonate aldolase (KDO 8-P synthase)